MPKEVDVVIVGGGAAGLNAGLVLARARRSVVVVDSGQPRNARAGHMHGYLAREGIAIPDLIATGRREVADYGGEIFDDEVVSVTREDDVFVVELASNKTLVGRRILVATGLSDVLPEIPGVKERWGRDVLHCPYCHGYEAADTRFGVLAAGPEMIHQALSLLQWSDDITLLLNGLELSDDDAERLDARGIRVVDGSVEELVIDDDRLTGARLDGGDVINMDTLFVGPEFEGNHSLLEALGAAIGEEGAVADVLGRTTVPGVFAAGNVVDPTAQVINAAGAGSLAAIGINNDLVDEDTDRAVEARRRSTSTKVG